MCFGLNLYRINSHSARCDCREHVSDYIFYENIVEKRTLVR